MYVERQFSGTKDDMLPGSGSMCGSKLNNFGCTRSVGHDGNHRAGTLIGRWAAEWDDDRSTDHDPSVDESNFFTEIGL